MVARISSVVLILTVLNACHYTNGGGSLDIFKSVDCGGAEKHLAAIVQWFFRTSNVLAIFYLNINGTISSFNNNHLVQELSSSSHVPVVYRQLQGNETRADWMLGGKTGVLIIGDSFETIRALFGSLSPDSNINRNGDFMFTVLSPGLFAEQSPAMDALAMGEFFRGLWTDFNILNSVIVVGQCAETTTTGTAEEHVIRDLNVGYFNPFEYVGGFESHSEQSWGKFYWTKQSALGEDDRNFMTKRFVKDFGGYPLKVNQFKRYPTAIDRTNIPAVVQSSYIYNKCGADDLFGHDALVLRNLELRLNFSKKNVPVALEYGWMLDNGTFVGTIGEILRKNIDVSFNGRFIKYYDTLDVNFMTPVLFENFCIVAPKALRIPEYLRIFQCFHPTVWAVIIIINLLLGCVWYGAKKILFSIAIHHHGQPKFSSDLETIPAKEIRIIDNKVTMRYKFSETVIEMWNIMLAAPSNFLPFRNVERVLMTFCLLANLIIVGTFQGSLTTSFSTVTYYKDIDTLQQLDDSGLPISIGSKSIMDIFGTGGSALIQSLASKMSLRSSINSTSMWRTAYERKAVAVERKADLNVIINTNFVDPGGRPLVHVVQECPRDYYVAYLTRTGWPLLPTFNWNIQTFFEAGFIQKWYEVTESAIIDHYRLTSPRDMAGESMKPLSLIDIQTSFYILGIGLILCTIVFVSELFCSKSTRLPVPPLQQDYYLVPEKASGINNKSRLLN